MTNKEELIARERRNIVEVYVSNHDYDLIMTMSILFRMRSTSGWFFRSDGEIFRSYDLREDKR